MNRAWGALMLAACSSSSAAVGPNADAGVSDVDAGTDASAFVFCDPAKVEAACAAAVEVATEADVLDAVEPFLQARVSVWTKVQGPYFGANVAPSVDLHFKVAVTLKSDDFRARVPTCPSSSECVDWTFATTGPQIIGCPDASTCDDQRTVPAGTTLRLSAMVSVPQAPVSAVRIHEIGFVPACAAPCDGTSTRCIDAQMCMPTDAYCRSCTGASPAQCACRHACAAAPDGTSCSFVTEARPDETIGGSGTCRGATCIAR